jgi:hypothetical protein
MSPPPAAIEPRLVEELEPAQLDARDLGTDSESGLGAERHREREELLHQIVGGVLHGRTLAVDLVSEGKAAAAADVLDGELGRPRLRHPLPPFIHIGR